MFSAATRRKVALKKLHQQQKRILSVAILLTQLDQITNDSEPDDFSCECASCRRDSCASGVWPAEDSAAQSDAEEEIGADEEDDIVRSLVNRQRRRTLLKFELLQTLKRDYDPDRKSSAVAIEEEVEEEPNEVFSLLSSSQERLSHRASLSSSDLLSSRPSSSSRLSLSQSRLFGAGMEAIRTLSSPGRHSLSTGGRSDEYVQLGEPTGSFKENLDRPRAKKVSFQERQADVGRPPIGHRWYNSVDSVGVAKRKDAGWLGRFHRALRWSLEGVGENSDLLGGDGPVVHL